MSQGVRRLALMIALAMTGCADKESDSVSQPPKVADDESSQPQGPVPLTGVFDGWSVGVVSGGGMTVQHKYADVIRMKHIVFGSGWSWGLAQIQSEPEAVRIDTKLPMQGRAEFGTASPRTLEIELSYEVTAATRVDGVGMQFDIDLDSPSWGPERIKPTLLPDNGGFTVPVEAREDVRVQWDGPGRAFFERKNPRQVRIYMLEGNVNPGTYRGTLKIEVPSGGQVRPSIAERYAASPDAQWMPSPVVWNEWPIDVGFLSDGDRPAGTHGRVLAKGDALVFEDGTPIRFWGTNVSAQSLFVGSRDDVKQQAQRLSALGFNLVRLHHHDSAWVRDNVFDPSSDNTQALRPEALQRLDWWIKCLRDEGVYVWVDLHVGRAFKRGDGIDGFDELARAQKGEAKGFNYVNPRIESLMQSFTQAYLARTNEFTSLSWAEDPAVVAVLVTNENDLGDHFGALMLPNKGHPTHQRMFETQARAVIKELGLPSQEAMRTWEPGAGKVLLAELQHRFDARAFAHLDTIKAKPLRATTSYWGRNNLWTLPALSAGDVVDVHSYGEEEALSTNPHRSHNWIHFIGPAQLVGKPMTVTEWNVPPPARDRFTAPLYVASIGALQGWDALMLYAYNQGPVQPPRRTNKWSAWTDPALIALAPAAAVMYRRGDVTGAKQTYVLALSTQDLFGRFRNAERSVALRTLVEQSKLSTALPEVDALDWLPNVAIPDGATVVTDLDQDFLQGQPQQVVSDTGEIRRDWAAGVQTIDTARSQAVSGWVGNRALRTRDASFDLSTAKATVVLTALDDAPLRSSRRILVTAVARARPDAANAQWESEPVRGFVGLRSEHAKLEMTAVAASDRTRDQAPKRDRIQGVRKGERTSFELPAQSATHWYLITAQ